MDFKLEVIVVPVSDVDAAKTYYSEKMGFKLDNDVEIGPGMRIVQLTPPGSGCSIIVGTGLPPMEMMAPGSIKGLQLVVDDIEGARDELLGRGVECGDVQLMGPEGQDGAKFLFFEDPDGNAWAVQEWHGAG
ncbi:MAG: VOC family protein [Solirubrobacterales bacterium]